MPHYMLDTDISSYLIRGDHPEVLEQLRKHLDEVCISCITEAELQYGAMKRNSRPALDFSSYIHPFQFEYFPPLQKIL